MDNKLELLKRFFSNKYSRNDYVKLKKVLFDQPSEFEELMQEHWANYNLGAQHKKKDLFKVYALFEKGQETVPQESRLKKLAHSFSRIAAILIVPLALALGYLYFQFDEYLSQKEVYVEVKSPVGIRTTLNLPDGSRVWLNGNSKLSYPVVFNEKREVNVQGEAFFKVQSDLEYPFLVGASGVYVQAMGTEFNVVAYEDAPEVKVILKEGKVGFLNENKANLKKLEPGFQLVYNTNTSSIKKYSEVNASDYTSWTKGKLIFNNSSLEDVITRMKHWYGIDIEIVDKELCNLHFKATFIEENIEEALRLLQSTATFEYHYAKRKELEDGSFEKAKIYITKFRPMR